VKAQLSLIRPLAGLTKRQFQVLSYLGVGYSDKEVARLLSVSLKTVRHHREAIMRVLHVSSAGQLAARWYAIQVERDLKLTPVKREEQKLPRRFT
jgi:DNA-binding CsgD family transcriptional regulator